MGSGSSVSTLGASASASAVLAAQRLEFECAILSSIQSVRTKEGRVKCLDRVQRRLSFFRGREYRPEGTTVIRITKEGRAACDDAVAYLRDTSDVDFASLDFSAESCEPLRYSAEDHAVDVGVAGIAAHQGTDHSEPKDRMSRYGTWLNRCSEIIWYGRIKSDDDDRDKSKDGSNSIHRIVSEIAQEIIDDLIIDDGVQDRGHRRAIFDAVLKRGGVGVSYHEVYGHVVVVNMASDVMDEKRLRLEEGELAASLAIINANEEVISRRKQDFEEVRDAFIDKDQKRLDRAASGPLQLPTSMIAKVENDKQLANGVTQWESLGVCSGCAKDIRGGRVIEVPHSDQKEVVHKYHGDCFLCSMCKESLQGKPFKCVDEGCEGGDKGGKASFMCEKCWIANFAPICNYCKKRIAENRYAILNENKLHTECVQSEKEKILKERKLKERDKDFSTSASTINSSSGTNTGLIEKVKDKSFASAKKVVNSLADDYNALP